MLIAHALWTTAGTVAGLLPGTWTAPAPQPCASADVLIHGASAGEVKAACAVRDVLSRAGEQETLISTGTATGLLSGADVRLPRDVPRRLEAFFDRVDPRAIVLIEGEIWPNLLGVAAARGIPVGVLGARLSTASARAHALTRTSSRRWFSLPTAWAAATEGDAARLRALGVAAAKIRVTGWLKWPAPLGDIRDAEQQAILSAHGASGPLFVLGSVHPGEVTRAWKALRGTPLDPAVCRWVVVPRHPRRAGTIERELPPSAALDARFGALRSWFAAADVALVGGGAGGKGTHDLLEPLQAGLRPLYFDGRRDDIASTLRDAELAVPLSGPIDGALRSAGAGWVRLQERHDGRQSGLEFLAAAGVPVWP